MGDAEQTDAVGDDTQVVGGSVAKPTKMRLSGVRPGERIGRYLLLEERGRGGMGVVMAAYDAQLDRTVALKLLRADAGDPGASADSRLIREAQALARLQHPAVVTVYEVGQLEGHPFIAMEYVEGLTLKQWWKQRRPPWRDIVSMCVRAGRGLAAAHAAGLVHRDVKPTNVLVGVDETSGMTTGRVCVVDFGIATGSGIVVGPVDQTAEASDARLTRDGTVMGTPAYMAPEQLRGQTIDARSDQFSFCVMLYEALYRRLPFSGATLRELSDAIQRGVVDEPRTDRAVPVWLRRAIRRGLAPRPEDRWPSMDALLDALERGSGRRRLAIMAGVTIVAIGGVGLRLTTVADTDTCDQGTARLTGVWDDDVREKIEAAFSSANTPLADDAWLRVQRSLDAFAQAWTDMHAEACRATHVDGTQPERVLDLRMVCLDERLSELEALSVVLSEADAQVIVRAAEAAADLTPVSRCADVEALSARVPPPSDPQVAATVAQLRQRLARAEALESAGRYAEGITIAKQVHQDALQVDYVPVAAEALQALGSLQVYAGQFEEAEKTLTEATLEAAEANHDTVEADAASRLAYVVGYRLARHDEGLRWSRHAEAALSRGGGGGEQQAEILVNEAAILFAQASYDEALDRYERALKLREAALGPSHPSVGTLHSNLAAVYVHQARFDEARASFDRAVEIWGASLGPEHPHVGTALSGLAALYERTNQSEAGIEAARRALDIQVHALGAHHPSVATTRDNLGALLQQLGRHTKAREQLERALAIRLEVFGEKHPHTAASLLNLGLLYAELGQHDPALQHLEQAIDAWEATLGPEHPQLAHALTPLGRQLLTLGDHAQAVQTLQRSLTLLRRDTPQPEILGQTRAALARALWHTGDHDQARDLAHQALTDFERAGPATEEDATKLRRWLRRTDPSTE